MRCVIFPLNVVSQFCSFLDDCLGQLAGQSDISPLQGTAQNISRLNMLSRRCKRLSSLFSITSQVDMERARLYKTMRGDCAVRTNLYVLYEMQIPALSNFCALAGLGGLSQDWLTITKDMECRPYDLLDIDKAFFDRDYVEYSVNVSDLKLLLQVV